MYIKDNKDLLEGIYDNISINWYEVINCYNIIC